MAALIGFVGVVMSGLSLIPDIYLAYSRIWQLELRPPRSKLRTLAALAPVSGLP